MTAGTRSLRSVLSELLLVTVARSCGGGSSITDSSYRSRSSFFFSSPQLVRGLSFSCFDTRHTLARPAWSASWFFSPSSPFFHLYPTGIGANFPPSDRHVWLEKLDESW